VDRSLAIDILRAVRVERRGYRVWTQTILATITPKNRLLLAAISGGLPYARAPVTQNLPTPSRARR
jgi:hypothetical protein